MNATITDIERFALEMMVSGHTDTSIARNLSVSKRTFERILAGLMQRAGVSSRVALGAMAVHRNWINMDQIT